MNVQVSPSPSVNISVGAGGNLLNLTPQGYTLHANTHISGGIDAIDHNFLLGLQGGDSSQYYHLNHSQYLNLTTGDVIRPNQTGQFYASSNPSGFVNVSSLSFTGSFDNRLNTLESQTGLYTLHSETGAFYASSNPSNYTTKTYVDNGNIVQSNSITDLKNHTGDYALKSNTGQFLTTGAADNRYVDLTNTQTIYGTKNFSNDVYINHLYVTGSETLVNTTNSNVESPYLILNLTGGATDGGIFFVTGSGLTGINDSGAIIGFDHSDKFKFGISTRANDLSSLPTIGSVEQITGLSGYLQLQITNLNNHTGDYYLQTNPSGFITGVNLSPYATIVYTTGISGSLQNQIAILNDQTGSYYPASNPSGYLTSGGGGSSSPDDSNLIIGLSMFL